MAFIPLEGLVMATRSGAVDPGVVLWLEEHELLSPDEVATALEQCFELSAIVGTGAMCEIEAAADRGDPDAALARDVDTHRLAGGIGKRLRLLGAAIVVITAREDLQIAGEAGPRHCRAVAITTMSMRSRHVNLFTGTSDGERMNIG